MNTNLSIRRSLSRYSILLVSLLTLVGILSGCGASSKAVPSHPTGSTPTSTPTKELKGMISEFPLPTPNFYPGGLLAGPDGNLWFTEFGNNNKNNRIARITTAGTISEFPLPTPHFYPFGITVGPDRNLWFIEAGLNNKNYRIGRITTTGTISEFHIPANLNQLY